jgi:hypothetical protein
MRWPLSRRFVVDTSCVAALFCIMAAFANWHTLETADYMCIIYVHVLICNILIEFNSPTWMTFWHEHGEREGLYALLGRVFFEFAVCALLAVLIRRR